MSLIADLASVLHQIDPLAATEAVLAAMPHTSTDAAPTRHHVQALTLGGRWMTQHKNGTLAQHAIDRAESLAPTVPIYDDDGAARFASLATLFQITRTMGESERAQRLLERLEHMVLYDYPDDESVQKRFSTLKAQ